MLCARTVEAAPDMGIRNAHGVCVLLDNWQQSAARSVGVDGKMFHLYLRREQARCVANGASLGDRLARPQLPRLLLPIIEECGTRNWKAGVVPSADRRGLFIARHPAGRVDQEAKAPHGMTCRARWAHSDDLMIRTGGEKAPQRFRRRECAYAELVFRPVMWPDFGAADLAEAVEEFACASGASALNQAMMLTWLHPAGPAR